MRNIRKLLISNEQAPARVAIILNLSDRRQATFLTEAAKKQIGFKYACDAVVLSSEDILRISEALEPERLLSSMILSQVDLVSISPFVITGPEPIGMFFGRERATRD